MARRAFHTDVEFDHRFDCGSGAHIDWQTAGPIALRPLHRHGGGGLGFRGHAAARMVEVAVRHDLAAVQRAATDVDLRLTIYERWGVRRLLVIGDRLSVINSPRPPNSFSFSYSYSYS